MKTYTATQVRKIANDALELFGDTEIVERFEDYIAKGYFTNKRGSYKKTKPQAVDFEGNSVNFKPMLSVKATIKSVKNFPVIGQIKENGFRCLIHPELGPVTRTLSDIANTYVSSQLDKFQFLDGELVTLDKNGKVDDLETINEKLSSPYLETKFKFIVFDHFEMALDPYEKRFEKAKEVVEKSGVNFIEMVTSKVLNNAQELIDFEQLSVGNGAEGIVVKSLDGFYKFGRSTIKQALSMKIKRFFDDEATLADVIEGVNSRTAGALIVKWRGKEFNLGNTWGQDKARDIWNNRHILIGKKVTFRYTGLVDGYPQFATFIGFYK